MPGYLICIGDTCRGFLSEMRQFTEINLRIERFEHAMTLACLNDHMLNNQFNMTFSLSLHVVNCHYSTECDVEQ